MISSSEAPPEADQNRLIALAIKGDEEAFGTLYSLHLTAIYRYIFFRVGDEAEAEDLTEEVFVKAWQALPKYRPREHPFTSWLYRIAHNLTVDYHRKQVPISLSDPDLHSLPTMSSSTEDIVEHHQSMSALAAAVRQLDDWEQDVVILRFVHGLSHQEVAAMIGKSVNATRVVQHRALAKLNKYMKDQGQHHV
jgi:RNA polymerase sigma-70 factor (ECF subfamily)